MTLITNLQGQGVPAGGALNQTLVKLSGVDFDTGWATPTGGSGTFLPLMVKTQTLTQFSSSTAENTLVTLTSVPAQLQAGDRLRLAAIGEIENFTGSSVNYTYRLRVGGTLVLATAAVATTTGTGKRAWELRGVIELPSLTSWRLLAWLQIGQLNSGGTVWGTNFNIFHASNAGTKNFGIAQPIAFTCQMGTSSSSAWSFGYAGSLHVER